MDVFILRGIQMSHIEYALVDFDATLTLIDQYPEVGELNMEAISVLKEFQELGGKVILGTAREFETLEIAIEALAAADFTPDFVNENAPVRIRQYGKDCRKYMADVFIDDRSIDFSGNWKYYRRVLIEDNRFAKEGR